MGDDETIRPRPGEARAGDTTPVRPGDSQDTTLSRRPDDPLEHNTLSPVAPADGRANITPLENPGDEIGSYKLIAVRGEGGFGTVWLAERRKPFTQQVALKIIKAGMDSKAVIARFEQERQALAVMNHPNIAKVIDGGITPSGRPYFAMEFVNGETITEFCNKHMLSLRDRLNLFIQVCEAIQHAHMKGILHRDLKPGNILVTASEGDATQVKVIDFGIAKALTHKMSENTIFTETGHMIGTPEYMSPEQAESNTSEIDTRTDVYSLGVILYKLLSGVLPFDLANLRTKSYREIQHIIKEVDPPSPSTRLSKIAATDRERLGRIARARREQPDSLVRKLKGELEWIPLKAMRKERSERYTTPNDLAADIRNYLNGRPLVAGPVSAVYRLRKHVRRNRGLVASAIVVVAALMVGLYAAWYSQEAITDRNKSEQKRVESEESTLKAKRAAYVSNIQMANIANNNANLRGLREKIEDIRELGLPGATDRFEFCYLDSVANPDPAVPAATAMQLDLFRGHEDGVTCVALSPDGKTLASAGWDDTIRLWDVDSGKPFAVLAGHEKMVSCVAFSPDGGTLASAGDDKSMRLWDVSSGKQLAKLEGHDDAVRRVAFSPDGKTLASASDDKTVRLWNVDRHEQIKCFTGHENGVTCVAFSPDGKTLASASFDKSIRLWDLAGDKPLAGFAGHERGVTCVAFSPDGKTLASASFDETIRIWDLTNRRPPAVLVGHEGDVMCVAFSPDGKTLASTGWDNSIRLWDGVSRKPLAVLRGHENWVNDLAFSGDGKTLASASWDKTVRLWRADSLRDRSSAFNARNAEIASARSQLSGELASIGDDADSLSALRDRILTDGALQSDQRVATRIMFCEAEAQMKQRRLEQLERDRVLLPKK